MTETKEFIDIAQDRQIRPVHPGEIIADILEDIGVSQTKLAQRLGISRRTVNEIIQGKRSITVDTALRLGKAFGNGPRLWLNLQQKVDIWDALQKHGGDYEQVKLLDPEHSL
ncbi:MAG: HigA family addiction module antitoxin [Thermostichus sp. BF3_bins_97]